MNKLALTLIMSILINLGFSHQSENIKFNKQCIHKLKIQNKEYYLIPIEENCNPSIFQPDPNGPNPCKGSLICYACCTGEKKVYEESCKIFKNWNKGKECNCSD